MTLDWSLLDGPPVPPKKPEKPVSFNSPSYPLKILCRFEPGASVYLGFRRGGWAGAYLGLSLARGRLSIAWFSRTRLEWRIKTAPFFKPYFTA